MTPPSSLSRAAVEAAARRIAPFVQPTPLVASPWLSDATGAGVWLKLEIVQATGSFKARGAAHAVSRLLEDRPGLSDLVAASAGNHGLAVAWAAARLGVRTRVYVPASAPRAKRDAIARLGAAVVTTPTYDEAEALARADAAAGAVIISPYDDDAVIAGAGTVALEMLDARPDLDVLVVPLGGGGLLAGTALVARERPGARVTVVGAEAAASPVFTTSLAAGRVTPVDVRPTLADGLAGNMDPESRTFAIVQRLVDRVVAVDEPAIGEAMRGLLREERLVVEGAGAAGVAALLAAGPELRGRRVGVILSGRNVDVGVLIRVATHAAATA